MATAIVLTLVVGGFVALCVLALAQAAGRADEQERRARLRDAAWRNAVIDTETWL